MLLYYITDRKQFGGDEIAQCKAVINKIAEAAIAGVDYVQLRERDLTTRELESLAQEAVKRVRQTAAKTQLLINSRIDIALTAGADGVHLRSDDIPASEARAIWDKAAHRTNCVIAQSCHSLADVLNAEGHGANFVVFGPVFEKQGTTASPTGVKGITGVIARGGPADPKVEAGQSLRMPVIALGSVSFENAAFCLRAGAAGVAAIRMFQQGDIAEVVRKLRAMSC